LARSWPNVFAEDRRTGADLVEIIDRIRWRLWRGQVARSLDLIGDTLVRLDGFVNAQGSAAVAARKVARLLRDLETYICGQSDIIIDYATHGAKTSRFRRQSQRVPCSGSCTGE
jgi:hypothetical protein